MNARHVDVMPLEDGDLIQLGLTVFRFIEESATARGLARDLSPGPPAAHAAAGEPVLEDPAPTQEVPARSLQRHAPRTDLLRRVGHGGARARPAPFDASAWQPGIADPWRMDEPVSLADMVSQARRVVAFFHPHRVLIAACAGIGLALGGLSLAVSPPVPAAFFDVRLHSKASTNPLERYDSANVEFFRSAPTTFRSTGLIGRTLAALGEGEASMERVDAVQRELVFDNTGLDQSAQTWTGRYRGASAVESLAFLTKHVELYLAAEIDKTLKIIKAQVEFLESHLGQTEQQLRATEAQLLDFKRENIDGLPEQARQYYDYLFELQRKESDLANAVNRLEAEAAVDARRLELESPLVESRVLATRPYQQAIVDVNRQRAEARSRGLADDHPDMRQLDARLAELRRLASDAERSTDDTEVERSRNPIYESTVERLNRLRVAAAATREERSRLRQDQQRIKAIVDRLPKLEADHAELTRSYDATKQLHTRIFDQLKTAQLQYELERASASARYEIITPPRLEHVSLMRTGVKRAALLSLLGACAALVTGAWMELRRLAEAKAA